MDVAAQVDGGEMCSKQRADLPAQEQDAGEDCDRPREGLDGVDDGGRDVHFRRQVSGPAQRVVKRNNCAPPAVGRPEDMNAQKLLKHCCILAQGCDGLLADNP